MDMDPWNYRQIYRWICKPIFKSGQIYSQICKSRKDLRLHCNWTLLWCCFKLRHQLEERIPDLGEKTTLHSCYQIIVHLWEKLASEGGFHKVPDTWLVSYPSNLDMSTGIYNSTRLTTSQILPRSWPNVSLLWRVSNKRGTMFNTSPQMLAAISRQCSQTWSTQPCQWAIQLHPHSMEREWPLWGRTLLTVPEL